MKLLYWFSRRKIDFVNWFCCICIVIFMKFVHGFFSLWNWFRSWNEISFREISFLNLFVCWVFSSLACTLIFILVNVDFSLHENLTMIVSLLKLILFIQSCVLIFVHETPFLLELLFVKLLYLFSLYKFCIFFLLAELIFFSWNLLHADFCSWNFLRAEFRS